MPGCTVTPGRCHARRAACALLGAGLAWSGHAQQAPPPPPPPADAYTASPAPTRAPPDPDPFPAETPSGARGGGDLEPAVTVQDLKNRVIQEYRVGNNLYMIKVTPKHGVPYYLVDPDGSGTLEWRRDSLGQDLRVPKWSVFRW